jgi:quercetin dioxygenase-like cupin family protein
MNSLIFSRLKNLKIGAAVINQQNMRVWTIKKDDRIRINLVKFSGELARHLHPDASHSIMVLDGKLLAEVSGKTYRMTKGDFISIPQGEPHSYRGIGGEVTFVSMDAPYYDPAKTVLI